ncbi:MAG: threonine synthase [Alphaproteobacteria bacterium]|nr:threonine synthase [Alphaproteobacteria bacterium]
MHYVSTRGAAAALEFDDVLLAGLASDGGLYVPAEWPRLSADAFRALDGLPYAEAAVRVMTPFVGGRIPPRSFHDMVAETYARFDSPEVAPLRRVDDDLWMLELFQGPTLAFKDYALQLVGRLFDHVLEVHGERVTVVGATSGDTGSAAIEACRDRDRIEIFMLHPKGRVSEVQRRQMTTVASANVHNIEIEGTFDDCQDLVKAMFNDTAFRRDVRITAVNSINWARVMAQIVYYVYAALRVGGPDRPVSFAVPTGNFGNVFAGYAAARMGLPIGRLAIGSNRNDILTRYFNSGRMEMREVVPTLSPSMDIQVSSNFERLVFELYGRDGAAVAEAMTAMRATGVLDMGDARWRAARELFVAHRLDDDETKSVMRGHYEETGQLIDPHTAVGLAAARAIRDQGDVPVVALATAHPAKFPDAVEAATGIRPALPAHLSDLLERQERVTSLANDLAAVEGYVRGHTMLDGAA